MNVRVTQNDIARAAGVHNTTVSLSLRNSRLIPEETRKRIQAIAQQLGYFPDPALHALVAYRNARRARRELGTIAYVTNWETKWGWQKLAAHAQYHAGAQRKAAEIGYQLEHLWLGETGMSARRLGGMLLHRGITGVVLASHRPGGEDLSCIDWSRLSVVKIGAQPLTPVAARVAEDYVDRVRLALRQARSAGYRRVGFVLAQEWDDAVGQGWSAAFFGEQGRLRVSDRVPLFRLSENGHRGGTEFSPSRPNGSLALEDWRQEHRPDVIIGLGPNMPAHFEQLGVSIPDDVAYIDLGLDKPDGRIAGVQPNCDHIGALAVEMLAGQLLKNSFGLPTLSTVTSVGGTWCPGSSLPMAADAQPEHLARGA